MADEKVYVAFGDRNVVATTNDKEVRMTDEKVVEVIANAAAASDDASGGCRYSAYWIDMARAVLAALEKEGYTMVRAPVRRRATPEQA